MESKTKGSEASECNSKKRNMNKYENELLLSTQKVSPL